VVETSNSLLPPVWMIVSAIVVVAVALLVVLAAVYGNRSER
jgi:hypothetical protein